MMNHEAKFGCKRISSSEDRAEGHIFDRVESHILMIFKSPHGGFTRSQKFATFPQNVLLRVVYNDVSVKKKEKKKT